MQCMGCGQDDWLRAWIDQQTLASLFPGMVGRNPHEGDKKAIADSEP